MRTAMMLAMLLLSGCDCSLTELHHVCPLGNQCYVDESGKVFLSDFPAFQGECHAGVITQCLDDGTLVCEKYQGPVDEICDGKDNDCNGSIDDVNVEPSDSVIECSNVGVCANHIKECVAGTWTCFYPNKGPEICDGRDNDCNGLTDDNLPVAYSYPDDQYPGTDGVGPCRPAISQCQNGHEHTIPAVTPKPEVCNNGIDDNCDGFIDESGQPPPARAFVLSIDITNDMGPYLQVIADAYCSVAYSAEMMNTKTSIVSAGVPGIVPNTSQSGFVDAPAACLILQGLSLQQSGIAYMYEAVDLAEDSIWPPGYDEHHDLAFTDEPVIDAQPWTASLSQLETECVGIYDVAVFANPTTFTHDWVGLVQACGGTEEDITDPNLSELILDHLTPRC